jgi:hypothetical protein
LTSAKRLELFNRAEKRKKDAKTSWIGLLSAGVLLSVIACFSPRTTTVSPANPRLAVVNSAWDGSVYQVKEWLSKNLSDPDSLQFTDWYQVQKLGSGYRVRVRYRAKNSFGGYVAKDEMFYLDSSGNVVESR